MSRRECDIVVSDSIIESDVTQITSHYLMSHFVGESSDQPSLLTPRESVGRVVSQQNLICFGSPRDGD